MIFMSLLFECRDLPDRFRDERQHGEMARALDRLYQLPLMPGASAGDSLGNDLPLLRDEPDQPFFILVIDIELIVLAKAADAVSSDLLILFGHGLSSL